MKTTCTLLAGAILLGFVGSAAADKLVLVADKLGGPFGTAFNPAGDLVFVEMTGHRVGKIDAKGQLTILAGSGQKGDAGDNGPPLQATFNGMHSLAVAGDVAFLADTWNNRVRKLDLKTGKLTPFAGTGEKGFSGDGGPADKAKFGGVYAAALDPKAERLFLADLDNRRIRAIDLKTGVVTTVAGNGQKGVPKDMGVATEEPLVDPRAVAADSQGNVYVLERGGHALRVVGPGGKIRTVVGTGKAGLGGDDGDALKAQLNGPKHLCVDADDNVLIADTENHVIRKYLPKEGKIVRVAGSGKKGTAGVGGAALDAEFNQPHGVTVGPGGALVICDSSNNRILKIER